MFTKTFNDIDLPRLRRLVDCLAGEFSTQLVIGLVGTLGTGKTTFTQALAEATGVDREDVTSPTFTLLCSYPATITAGSIQLHHLDAYRLRDEDEFLELGVEELFESDGAWVLVEWADRVESVMPHDTLWIDIGVMESGADQVPNRTLTFSTHCESLARHVDAIANVMADGSS